MDLAKCVEAELIDGVMGLGRNYSYIWATGRVLIMGTVTGHPVKLNMLTAISLKEDIPQGGLVATHSPRANPTI